MKICSKCGSEKNLLEFYKDSQKKDGYRPDCISCSKGTRKGYRSPNHALNNRKYDRGKRAELYKKNPLYYLWYLAKKRASQKGLDFNIEPSDIIFTGYCPITGEKLDIGTNKLDTSISLDRVDNSKGYIKGNVVAISRWANLRKSDMSWQDLSNIMNYMERYIDG